MEEVFLFEKQIRSGDHVHTVLVSETLEPEKLVVYNCIVDIHTNIQIVFKDHRWVEKNNGETVFSKIIGMAIESFVR